MTKQTFLTVTKPQLLKAKQQILDEPKNFVMGAFSIEETETDAFEWEVDVYRKSCGTMFCIAGRIADNNGLCTLDFNALAHVLGMQSTELQTSPLRLRILVDLFYVSNWPVRYRNAWHKTRSLKRRAEIAARLIDAFLRKLEKQITD